LNNKDIIFRLIFELGYSVYFIAKALGTSEAQIYRYLSDEKLPPKMKAKLKSLWADLVKKDEFS